MRDLALNRRSRRRLRLRQPGRLLPARAGGTYRPRRRRHRDDAQGSSVRHGVRLRHLPARTGAGRGGRGRQRPGRPARLQREVLCHRLSGIARHRSSWRRAKMCCSTSMPNIGDVVFKKLDGMGGTSIFRVRSDDPNLRVVVETLTGHGTTPVMAQTVHPGDQCRRQAHPVDRRRTRSVRAGAHSECPARPGATWRPAARASVNP